MKKFLLVMLIVSATACKNDQKESKNEPLMKEVMVEIEKENVTKVSSLEEFVQLKEKPLAEKVNEKLGNVISIKSISTFEEPTTRNYIVIELESVLSDEERNNYRIIVRSYPSDTNQLTDYVKNNRPGLIFDTWYLEDLNVFHEANGTHIHTKRLSDGVSEYDKMKLELYDIRTEKIVPPHVEVEFY